jgi:hypothetical protein
MSIAQSPQETSSDNRGEGTCMLEITMLEITRFEAFDLFKKWHDEGLNMGCSVTAIADGKAFLVGCIIGRIKNISDDALSIETVFGPSEMQSGTRIEIPLSHASFSYLEPPPESELDREISEVLTDLGTDRIVESCLRVHLEKSCIVFDLLVTPNGLEIQSLP